MFTGTDANERASMQLEPTAIFKLSLEDTNENRAGDFGGTSPSMMMGDSVLKDNSSCNIFSKDIVFEADTNALYDLYYQLESIQAKLDELKE